MKKILSVSLIVIMILAMGLSALGIGAEEVPAPTVGITEEATGADATTAGNLTEPGSKTFDSSWTAISDEAGLNSMAADGKYYLTGNITVTSTRNNTANQTIDGNGYTITANCPIFNEVKGLTLQNVTIKSTLNHNADGNVTALAKWNSDSKPVCVYNVTLEADIVSVKNNGNHQYFGGFVMRSCAGSEFKNVVVTTNVTLDNAEVAIVNSVGGIVARAQGTTFDNCIANGTFTFKQDPFKDNNVTDSGVGGIAGAATNNSVIKNCTNNVVFNVDAPKSSNLQGIGGIVGFSNAGTTFENCVNNGNITTGEAATGWWLGGIVGNYYGGISIQKCKNTADINCVAADYVGGILGYSHKANANISNCLNTGDISGPYAVGGIVGFGAKESGDCVIKNSTNAGKITGSVYAGGIAGYIGLGSVSLCSTTEESEILLTGTCTMKDQDTYAASILASGASLVSDCEAYGSVTVDGAATTSAIYAGGVVGRINNGGAVKNCVNYATVTVRNTSRFVAAAGVLANTGWAATLDNCVNHADITVEETVQFLNQNDWGNAIGGVAGKLNANSTITNSVNKGKIEDKGAESDGDVGVGGILGFFAAANLTIEDCTNEGELISKSYAGGILGNALNRNTQAGNVITIKDSCNKGTVTADKRAGGIVGYVQKIDFGASHIAEIAKVDVSDCTNNATVYGGSYAGGIVSAVEATATVINNCANNSEVSGGNVGGIIGSSKSALSITNAINNGKVKAGNSAGGIICLVDSGSTAAIENCVNLGTVEGAYRTAGIAGFIKGAVTATNCVNGAEGDNTKGLIKTTSGDAWGAAGGIFGWVEGADCSMKGCINYVPIYAYGNSTNADAGMAGAGGLVGKAAKTVIIGGTQEGEACLNYGAVTAENNAGAGGIIGGMNANMTFANCHNYADVFAIGASAGSVVGRVGGNVTITGIVNELSSGKVRGYGYLGSLIGGADGTVTLDGIVSNEDISTYCFLINIRNTLIC